MAEDTRHRTRAFALGSLDFEVTCSSDDLRQVIEAVFVDLAIGVSGTSAELHVEAGEQGHYRLNLPAWMDDGDAHVGERRELLSPTLTHALTTIVSGATRLALDHEPDALHLHCAALASASTGLIVTAAPGTGKTTLAAALIRQGWSYLSDEMIAMRVDSSTVAGTNKPLTLKPGGFAALPAAASAFVPLEASADASAYHTPASRLGASLLREVTPNLIAVLVTGSSYETDATVTPLHPAEATVAMMTQTMDAERFGAGAIRLLAEVAARCSCVQLTTGSLASEVDAIEALAERPPSPPQTVRVLTPSDASALEGWAVAPGVTSVLIGDRVAVHSATGAVASFDVAATSFWLALHGEAPDWWTDEMFEEPTTASFLAQLEQAGLVARTSVVR